jgi:hypothetical protein
VMDGHHTQTQSRVCDSTDLFSFIFIMQRLSRTQQGTSFESGQDEDSGTSWTRRSSSTAKFQTTRTSTTGTGSGHPTLLSITSDDHVRNFYSKIFHHHLFVVWPFLGLNLGSGWMVRFLHSLWDHIGVR